jgi:hypothetical protein
MKNYEEIGKIFGLSKIKGRQLYAGFIKRRRYQKSTDVNIMSNQGTAVFCHRISFSEY